MTRAEILETLKQVMKESSVDDLDVSKATEESEIAQLGFDSLTMLDLLYDVQQAFGIDFEAEEMTGIKTVADLVAFIEGQQAGA